MQQVKTVIILNDFNYINGGAAQMAIGTANALADRGYRVIFFSAAQDPSRPSLSDKVEQYSTDQPDILNNPSRIAALKDGIWNKIAASKLSEVLARIGPEDAIIHLHGWTKALSPSIGRVITDSGIPVVCTLHDYFAACPNGGFYNYQKNEICRLKAMSFACICSNCDARNFGHKAWRVARQAVQSTRGNIPRGIRHYISITRFSEDILRPYLPADADIYLLSNPVGYTVEGHPRADTSQPGFLYIGRLSSEKGINLACDAARSIGARLTIIGDGPLSEELKRQYPEVEFTGWLSSPQIFDHMLRATALIFPSRWYETQGLTVLEALSVGLPVIVSDACAAREYTDGRNGSIFTSGDSNDLAAKMKNLLDDPAATEAMSRYAHDKYWQQPFLFETYIDSTISIYRQILEKEKQTI